MNRLMNNEKMNQNETLASAIVELSDAEMEQVVGGSGGYVCPEHHDWHDDDYGHNRKGCGCDDYRFYGCRFDNDLLSDLLGLL